MPWRPVPSAEAGSLRLSPLEEHLLRRLDGAQELEQLAEATGLPPQRVEELLARLVQAGAVLAPPGEGEDPASAEDPPAEATDPEQPLAEAPGETIDPLALHARSLAPLDLEARVHRARLAVPPELSAFCVDPSARVIAAVLENPRTGLAQARLIARHHRDAVGLERMLQVGAYAADAVVQRELLKNPQLQLPVLRRLWGSRRSLELWRTSTSHEATEQARLGLKDLFRTRFAAAEAEERVEAILKTDGRCLAALSTVPVDGRTVALLCARTYSSSLLVQNVARWGAAPTALLAHLLRQAVVRHNRVLRLALQQHPNAPAGAE